MPEINDIVRVLPPFTQYFGDTYKVIDVIYNDEGTVVHILDQDAGGFDAIYVELVV